MKYLILLIFLCSCGKEHCTNDVCPYEHKGCVNCESE